MAIIERFCCDCVEPFLAMTSANWGPLFTNRLMIVVLISIIVVNERFFWPSHYKYIAWSIFKYKHWADMHVYTSRKANCFWNIYCFCFVKISIAIKVSLRNLWCKRIKEIYTDRGQINDKCHQSLFKRQSVKRLTFKKCDKRTVGDLLTDSPANWLCFSRLSLKITNKQSIYR